MHGIWMQTLFFCHRPREELQVQFKFYIIFKSIGIKVLNKMAFRNEFRKYPLWLLILLLLVERCPCPMESAVYKLFPMGSCRSFGTSDTALSLHMLTYSSVRRPGSLQCSYPRENGGKDVSRAQDIWAKLVVRENHTLSLFVVQKGLYQIHNLRIWAQMRI